MKLGSELVGISVLENSDQNGVNSKERSTDERSGSRDLCGGTRKGKKNSVEGEMMAGGVRLNVRLIFGINGFE